jgi:hypothetical protein
MTSEERDDPSKIPVGARPYRLDNLTSGAFRENTSIDYTYEGRIFNPGRDKCWKTTKEGLDALARTQRLQVVGNTLAYVRFIDDFPAQPLKAPLKALWTDAGTGGFGDPNDTDHNNLCFHVCQAFFPRTGAWDDRRRALRGEYDDAVWDHLAGTVSAPFEGGEHGHVAVKVIDDRGNELLVVKTLGDATT